MISFERFTMEDGSPIYMQLMRFVKAGAAAGVICDGDELPSRRALSALLGVNPNTVQKAYRLLEEEGLVRSHSGAKSVIVLNEAAVGSLREELVTAEARRAVDMLRNAGLAKEDALRLIEKLWNEEG